MEICIKGEAKEIASLVLELQERRVQMSRIECAGDPEEVIKNLASGLSDAVALARIP